MAKKVGRVIQRLRKAKKIGLRALAAAAEISPTYLLLLERGDRDNPSLDVLKRLAHALGVDVRELL